VGTTYQQQNVNLLANQFSDATLFQDIAKELGKSFDNVNDILTYLIDNLDVYKAEGFLLDIIGVIVGQPRTIEHAVQLDFFGFKENSDKAFGEARFWDWQESLTASSVLSDPEYRQVILARINYNHGDVTLTGIAESLSILFNTNNINVETRSNANISIYISKTLTSNEINLINAAGLIVRAAGVGFQHKLHGANVFGFKESGGLAFGNGPFVEEF
jgi:hypothetical protein